MNLDFEQPIVAIEEEIEKLAAKQKDKPNVQVASEIAELKKQLRVVKKEVYADLTPWQCVQVARHKDRPLLEDYISMMFDEFVELHGDRYFGDDRGLIGGFATLDKQKVMLLGFNKGKSIDEKIENNFGMGHPEGYRKALRLMRLAEKYSLPVISLIDTPAAYPGATAEERGQAEAIARNITEMATIETPIVAIITGEGGSGGALGIAVADVVMMLSNAIYSVIPPEGCAAILWRDADKASDAAEAMKITANSLLELGVIDEIIPEPSGGAHRDHTTTIKAVGKSVVERVDMLKRFSTRKLLARRYDKYARIGRPEA